MVIFPFFSIFFALLALCYRRARESSPYITLHGRMCYQGVLQPGIPAKVREFNLESSQREKHELFLHKF